MVDTSHPEQTPSAQPNSNPRPAPASQARSYGRFYFIGSSILIGIIFGVAAVMTGTWFWAQKYTQSPRFWQELSQGWGIEMKSAETRIRLLPPSVTLAGFEGRTGLPGDSGEERSLQINAAKIEVSLGFTSLLRLRPGLKVRVMDLVTEVVNEKFESKRAARVSAFAEGGSGLRSIPFRKMNVDVLLTRFKPPIEALPRTNLRFIGLISAQPGGAEITIDDFEALGTKASGSLALDNKGSGRFDLVFAEHGSLLAGTLNGTFGSDPSTRYSIAGKLKLPDAEVPISDAISFRLGVDADGVREALEMSGKARLAGEATFDIKPAKWTANAFWNFDLGESHLLYRGYEKPAGFPLLLKGKFGGDQNTWKAEDVKATLGKASATLVLESRAGTGLRVLSAIGPFEISDLVPVFAKGADLKASTGANGNTSTGLDRMSGRASAEIDLTVPPGESSQPSGSVKVVLGKWQIDGGVLTGLLGNSSFSAAGMMNVQGNLQAALEQGAFKTGLVRFNLDATRLALKYGSSFEKKEAMPLTISATADASGRTLVVKGIELNGPGGLKFVAKGRMNDVRSSTVNLKIADGRVPLQSIAALLPGAAGASGIVRVTGDIQGPLKNPSALFTNLTWDAKGASLKHREFIARDVSGKVQTIIGRDATSDGKGPEPVSVLVRFLSFSSQLKMGNAAQAAVTAQGAVRYKSHILSGDLVMSAGSFDLRRWYEGWTGMFPVDFKRSKFRLTVTSPEIRTPWLAFTSGRGVFRIGGLGPFDFEVEKLSGHALGGDLSVSGRVNLADGHDPFRMTVVAGGQDLKMSEVAALAQQLSGKAFDGIFFGTGDLDANGTVGPALSSTELKGKFQLRDGGLRFLPSPRKVASAIAKAPAAAKLGIDDSGNGPEQYEKTQGAFTLKGETLRFDATASDPTMQLRSKGQVSLSGHCDFTGMAYPKASLVGESAAQALTKGVSFSSQGDDWNCGFSPVFGAAVTGK